MSEVREISPEDAKYIDPNQVCSMRLSDGTTVVVKKEGETYEQTTTTRTCPIHSQQQQYVEQTTTSSNYCPMHSKRQQFVEERTTTHTCPIHSQQGYTQQTTTSSYRARAQPQPQQQQTYQSSYQATTTTENERGNYAGVVEDRRNYRLYESGVSNTKKQQVQEVKEEVQDDVCTCCTCNCNICPCCGKLKRGSQEQTTTYTEEVLRAQPRVAQTRTTETRYSSQTVPMRTSQTKTFISEYVQPKYVYSTEQQTTSTSHQCGHECQYCGKQLP